jgi:hypothetical protein
MPGTKSIAIGFNAANGGAAFGNLKGMMGKIAEIERDKATTARSRLTDAD